MTLKDRIRVLANAKGMSLPALEAELGFGNGTIVKWDKASPNSEKLLKVADFFNVTVDYLLGREPNDSEPDDDDIIFLSRNAKKLSPDQRKQLVDMAKLMFKEEFRD